MEDELYSVLGVAREATDEEIRKAYRKRAREHHPDLNPGDSEAEERFKKLSAAYEILSDSEKRAIYDEFGADAKKLGYDPERAEEYRQWRRRAEASAGFGGGAPGGSGPFGAGEGASYADLEDLIGNLFGRRPRGPRRGHDVTAALRVSFRDAALGAKAQIELPRPGAEATRVSLTIPAGVEDGQRLRLRGKGAPGTEGGPPGDLYVRVDVEPHSVFSRDGLDLHLGVPVTIPEALVGASVTVPTLESSVRVKVPAGSQNGTKLRLRGKGIAQAQGEPGDLIITLTLRLPDAGDDETRARLAEELRALYDCDVREALREEVAR